ncbi:hypothetical protein KIL84_014358, partial [Mauremys mutica]
VLPTSIPAAPAGRQLLPRLHGRGGLSFQLLPFHTRFKACKKGWWGEARRRSDPRFAGFGGRRGGSISWEAGPVYFRPGSHQEEPTDMQ